MIAHPFPSPGTALFLAELPGPYHRLPAAARERTRALARWAARFDEPEREDRGAVRYERVGGPPRRPRRAVTGGSGGPRWGRCRAAGSPR
ncbi:hypothetical protein GCM10020366_25730 [Saccharopolyspora gregorii]|uniref:Uncharacterized protein n=1 Tax=Saccharopolyspora gregorii TaxID=33914 RepID=A0ABP6RN17_9PSEU